MKWKEFYDRCYEWSVSTLRNNISKLSEFGPSDEVLDVFFDLPKEVTDQFVRKAIKFGVQFSEDGIMEMEDNVSSEFFVELIKRYIKSISIEDIRGTLLSKAIQDELLELKLSDIFNDEYQFIEWDDYYDGFYDFSISEALSLIDRVNDLGGSSEIIEVIEDLNSKGAGLAALKAFLNRGVKFDKDDIIELVSILDDEDVRFLIESNFDLFSIDELLSMSEIVEGLVESKIRDVVELTFDEVDALIESGFEFDFYDKLPENYSVTWERFYSQYDSCSKSRLNFLIEHLNEVGPATQIIEVSDYLEGEHLNKLVNLAISQKVSFTNAQVLELSFNLSKEVRSNLVRDNLKVLSISDLLYEIGEVNNLSELIVKKFEISKDEDLEELFYMSDEKLLADVLEVVCLTSDNQNILNEYYDSIPAMSKKSLLKRLNLQKSINRELKSQLELDLMSRRKRMKVMRKQGDDMDLYDYLILHHSLNQRTKESTSQTED